ncbi:MAG TPA: RDD family protein [Burkholderiales bacterium]|nr:RDD family protein [Burkholderiales bacterium]
MSQTAIVKPGKRLWAGGFDVFTVAVLFMIIAVVGELAGVDLKRWIVFAVLFFAYNLSCLVFREGRTVGKTAVDICVVSAKGRPLNLLESAIRSAVRSFPFFFLEAHHARGIPLATVALIGSISLLALFIAETTLLERSVAGRTIADRLAGSIVVNLPPLQPHRAPAAPMYSASDAEFGQPPRWLPGRNKNYEQF